MQEFVFIKKSPENIYLRVCSASFLRAQSASFLTFTLNSFQSVLFVSNHMANEWILAEVGDKRHSLDGKLIYRAVVAHIRPSVLRSRVYTFFFF